jgi:phosphatidylglycerophosphatase C
MELIAVFDFDGTLIKKDSMTLFFFRYFNLTIRNAPNFFRLFFETLKYFLKIYSQKQFKEKFINLVISLSGFKDIDALFDDFSIYLLDLVFKTAKKKIIKFRKKGFKTILLSASPDIYLEKISQELGFDEIICTRTIYNNNKIAISGLNCYGKDKIKMLFDKYIEDRVDWEGSYCYTDSESDKDLLDLFGNPNIVNNGRFGKNNPNFKSVIWK